MSGSPAGRAALERALELIEPARRPERLDDAGGYFDLLGERDATGPHVGQRLMESAGLARVYEQVWRPTWGRVLMGARGPGVRGEREIALQMLAPSAGDRVLDVGCGPGNFTRAFAPVAREGLVVGLDASTSMLSQAVRETTSPNVAYVRADAAALPFRDSSFDAVCCFAALYLIERPCRALDEMVRVLAPGGRLALLTSCNRGLVPASVTDAVVRTLSGVRVFGRDELTRALRERGVVAIVQRVSGFAQFVSGRRR